VNNSFTFVTCIHVDSVAAQSVVAIRRLLQQRPGDSVFMITQLTKALDEITEPLARANIFWLVGQYSSQLQTIAPDVLRKAAKTFATEVRVQHFFGNWLHDCLREFPK
jgi:vesicle coat complex subunit